MTFNKNTNKIKEKLKEFTNTRIGIFVLVLWTFFEPSFWFIAADVPLFLMSFSNPKKYKKFFLITLLSAALGVCFYFILNIFYFPQLRDIMIQTPLISSEMIPFVLNNYNSWGSLGSIIQAFSSVPIKVWISVTAEQGFSFPLFLFFTTISRAIRFFIIAFIGKSLANKLKKNNMALIIIFLVYIGLSIGLTLLSKFLF